MNAMLLVISFIVVLMDGIMEIFLFMCNLEGFRGKTDSCVCGFGEQTLNSEVQLLSLLKVTTHWCNHHQLLDRL